MFNTIEQEQIQISGLRVMVVASSGLCDIFQKDLEDRSDHVIATGMSRSQAMTFVCAYNAGRAQGISMAM